MLCPSCDQENPGFANFCQYCGFQFRDPPVDLLRGQGTGVRTEKTVPGQEGGPGWGTGQVPFPGEETGTPGRGPEKASAVNGVPAPGDGGQGGDGLTAAGYYEKGVELFNSHDFEAALAVLTLATNLDPAMDQAFNARGVCLARLGRTDEAVASYRKALALDPENEKYQKNLAVTRMKRGMAQAASRRGQGTPPGTPDADGGTGAGWPMGAPGPADTSPPATGSPAGGTTPGAESAGGKGSPLFPASRAATGTTAAGGLHAKTTFEQPPPVFRAAPLTRPTPPGGSHNAPCYFAGAWVRWVAYFVDTLIIVGISIVVMLPVVFLGGVFMTNIFAVAALFLAITAVYLLYFTLSECSAKQATPGKQLFRLFVTGNDGGRLTFLRSLARNLLKIVFTAGLLQVINGCVIWASPRGKGVHDYLAGTLVLTPDTTDKPYATGGAGVTGMNRVVVAVLVVLCVVAVIVAVVFLVLMLRL
jgi:uncharacterized RDD family membrane protein YckC